MYRSTHRAGCLSEKARSRVLSCYFFMGLMGVSAPSLHIESTNSMICSSCKKAKIAPGHEL